MKLLDQIILFDDEFTPLINPKPSPKHTQGLGEKFPKFSFYFPLLRICVTFRWEEKFELPFEVNSTPLCFDFDIFLLYLKLVCHSIWFHLFFFAFSCSLGGRRYSYQKLLPNFPKEVIKQIKITFKMFSAHTIVAGTVSRQPDSGTKMCVFPSASAMHFSCPQIQLYYENFILIVWEAGEKWLLFCCCPVSTFCFSLFRLLCSSVYFWVFRPLIRFSWRNASFCIMHYV